MNKETQRSAWHWKRIVSGITEGDSPKKMVNDLRKMTDRISLNLTEKIQLNTTNIEKKEDRLEMFKSDLAAAFQLMLEDTGLDKVVNVPPPKVEYSAVCIDDEEILKFEDEVLRTPMTPKSIGGRPSLASSDVSSSFHSQTDDDNWLSPAKSDCRKVHNDSLHDDRRFYFDLNHLDDE
ncbi:unnamed protein product [Cylindrotheca closterium]|uniref:Uncharacterized protein n=1 Tax=Cylindrotheca closterium TaxID=2856 RepID=A0AAD2FYJ4_9STRA|nr:unnamed protein product [Cylindrotheca closterium]